MRIIPTIGIDNIELGMNVLHIRELLSTPFQIRVIDSDHGEFRDKFLQDGIFIDYNSFGICQVITLVKPSSPELYGRILIGAIYSETRNWLLALDSDLIEDNSGCRSDTLQISLYADGINKDPDMPIEAVFLYCKGYYDK